MSDPRVWRRSVDREPRSLALAWGAGVTDAAWAVARSLHEETHHVG
jgi:hypothetical protein